MGWVFKLLFMLCGYAAIFFVKLCGWLIEVYIWIRSFFTGVHLVQCCFCGTDIVIGDQVTDEFGFVCRDCGHLR